MGVQEAGADGRPIGRHLVRAAAILARIRLPLDVAICHLDAATAEIEGMGEGLRGPPSPLRAVRST